MPPCLAVTAFLYLSWEALQLSPLGSTVLSQHRPGLSCQPWKAPEVTRRWQIQPMEASAYFLLFWLPILQLVRCNWGTNQVGVRFSDQEGPFLILKRSVGYLVHVDISTLV